MKPELTSSLVVPFKAPQGQTEQRGADGAPAPRLVATGTNTGAQEPTRVAGQGQEQAVDENTASRLQEVVDKLNLGNSSISRSLRFQFDDEANTSVIQVYDRETEQLIRQIPSEEALNRLRRADGDIFQLIEVEA